MKKDRVWSGLIGLVVGGLIGYLVGVQSAWRKPEQQAGEHTHQSSNPPSEASQRPGLPDGHPPVTTEADFETLKGAVERAPQNAALVTNLANKYYDAGRYEEAIRLLSTSADSGPQKCESHDRFGYSTLLCGTP